MCGGGLDGLAPAGLSGASSTALCSNEAWLVELGSSTPPLIREMDCEGAAPSARYGHTATLLGDTLYVLGGSGPADANLRDVHALHLPTSSWCELSAPPRARARARTSTLIRT